MFCKASNIAHTTLGLVSFIYGFNFTFPTSAPAFIRESTIFPKWWRGIFTHDFTSRHTRYFNVPTQVDELPGYTTKVDAAHGRWPQDGFCQVAYLRDGSTSSYQLSVDMYNFIGRDGVNFGHPGVFLNAEDQDNYDFVYFRFVAIYTPIRGKLSVFWFQTWATIWIFQYLLTTSSETISGVFSEY